MLFWHEHTILKSPSTPRTHLPFASQSESSIQCAVYKSHATMTKQQTPAKPLGRRRRDRGPSVSQHLEEINNTQALTPAGYWHESFLTALRVKEFPLLSASQSWLRSYSVIPVIRLSSFIEWECSEIICHVSSAAHFVCKEKPCRELHSCNWSLSNKQTTVPRKHLVEHFFLLGDGSLHEDICGVWKSQNIKLEYL